MKSEARVQQSMILKIKLQEQVNEYYKHDNYKFDYKMDFKEEFNVYNNKASDAYPSNVSNTCLNVYISGNHQN